MVLNEFSKEKVPLKKARKTVGKNYEYLEKLHWGGGCKILCKFYLQPVKDKRL